MSKVKTKIDPKRAERLKILIKREGLKQKQFADRINLSAEHVSLIINNKEGLSNIRAAEIIRQFPTYRLDWLLGKDDLMTNEDVMLDIYCTDKKLKVAEDEVLRQAIQVVCGYEGIKDGESILNSTKAKAFLEAQLFDAAKMMVLNCLKYRKVSRVWWALDYPHIYDNDEATQAPTVVLSPKRNIEEQQGGGEENG